MMNGFGEHKYQEMLDPETIDEVLIFLFGVGTEELTAAYKEHYAKTGRAPQKISLPHVREGVTFRGVQLVIDAKEDINTYDNL